jgi:hypothetical protein
MKTIFELGGLFRIHGWKRHINKGNKYTGNWYWNMENTALSFNSKPEGDPVCVGMYATEPWHTQKFHTTGQYDKLYIRMIKYKHI